MARKVRVNIPVVTQRPPSIAAGAADAGYRRTWVILGLIAVWLAAMAFFFLKNAAGQRIWYVPLEVLGLYGALFGISCWRRCRRPRGLVGPYRPPAPLPTTAEPRSFSAPRGVEGIEERLTRLSEMRDKGLITQAEYEARRREIIGEV